EAEPPAKIKRLNCNIDGCNYQTDRRRDLRRHRRSQKHMHHNLSSDSDSDFERSLWECKLCNYTTAKRFSFARHEKSVRHRRKLLIAREEDNEETQDKEKRQERPESPKKNTEVPAPSYSSQESDQEGLVYTCTTCSYTTNQRLSFSQHKKSTEHLESLRSSELERWMIEYEPKEEDVVEENSYEPADQETAREDDDNEISLEGCSTFECATCDYKTARRFCFSRHVQSRKHIAKILEENDDEVQKDLGFDVIEYDPAEEKDFEEIVYLPTEEKPEESCYYIVLNSD
ncbi:hypothetical protein KR009_008619, partial [Drosophila setifemur]